MVARWPWMRISPESAACAPDSVWIKHCRLSGTVTAHEGNDLAGMQIDRHPVDGMKGTATGHANVPASRRARKKKKKSRRANRLDHFR